jgi:prophage endopeptidase
MSRTELILVTAAILFAAFALGWFGHWLVRRVTRVDQADLGELERMAQALNEAEDLRDQAITYIQDREAALTRELAQTRAELEAAMDGLRDARHETEYLRRALEERG